MVLAKRYPNADGSMPYKRLAAWWKALHVSGHFSRPCHSTKITCLRNLFSDAGLIDWPPEGNYYRYSQMEGEKVQAMRWCMTEEAEKQLEPGRGESCYPLIPAFCSAFIRPVMLKPKLAPRPGYQGSNRVLAPPEYASVA